MDITNYINEETGEVISLLDPEIPLERKADAYAFVIGTLNQQRELHKGYISKHKNKIEKIDLLEEKITESFKQQMIEQGFTKIKTPENTLYFQTRKKLKFNIEEIPVEHCLVEIKGLVPAEEAESLIVDNPEYNLNMVRKKIKASSLEELISEGKVEEVEEATLCKR